MALTKRQIQGVCKMFANAFVNAENEDDRKKILIDFEDAFHNGITDWKDLCRQQIMKLSGDLEIITSYEKFLERNNVDKNIEFDIRKVYQEDFDQVREIVNSAFDMSVTSHDASKFTCFVESGYSFVAHKGDEILGVILAIIQPDMSVPCVYINSFAVAEHSRGQGIGKILFGHLKKHVRSEGMFLIKLQTDPNIRAYEIYKHWGLEESELIQMKCYCI